MKATERAGPRGRLRLLIEGPAVVVTFVMMVHVTVNALLRTFANIPVPATLELTQYWYLPVVALLGFVAAQTHGEHIVADLVFHRFPPPARRFVLFTGYLAVMLVMAGFAWYGLGEAVHAYDIGKTAGVSDIVAWPAYFLVPLVFAVLTVQFAMAASGALRGSGAAEGPEQSGVHDAADITTERS